ncbi:hypothetical protein BH18PSE1_BH18PSE1_09440 [soil metagenome]
MCLPKHHCAETTIGRHVPSLIIEDGRPLKHRMEKARIDEQCRPREQGTDWNGYQIKYAVLERNGSISIIPKHSLHSLQRER